MNAREFARRRRALMRQVGREGVVVLTAAQPKVRNRDVEYLFRQDSDFFYLTGFAEPAAVAVLIPKREAGEYVLFCRERDPAREQWDGPRAGLEGALEQFGADDAFPIDDLDDILPGLIEGRTRVYHAMGAQPEFDARLVQWMTTPRRDAGELPQELVSLEHMLHDMRLYKSRSEVALMRRAAVVAAQAHRRAMQCCRPGMFEYEVEAELAHTFRRAGARTSYPPIVASGVNACILHYIDNDKSCADGDLLLIDAGCEIESYASDITRTFPVNGRFSDPQRAIYELVLKAQYAAIEAVQPGNHWNAPHEAAVRVITRGLVRLGLLKGSVAKLINDEAYRRFFMHRTGHWLGMDVHDVGDYKVGDAWRELEAGMVLTVEPGIYIAPGSKGVPRKWWGIGVRIEDDVLVTGSGHEVLSADVPKEVEEIEALMASAPGDLPASARHRRSRARRATPVGAAS
ncbi:MAG: Xaa-Pro aminopeptidase [Pseudomonadota bacterium]